MRHFSNLSFFFVYIYTICLADRLLTAIDRDFSFSLDIFLGCHIINMCTRIFINIIF